MRLGKRVTDDDRVPGLRNERAGIYGDHILQSEALAPPGSSLSRGVRRATSRS